MHRNKRLDELHRVILQARARMDTGNLKLKKAQKLYFVPKDKEISNNHEVGPEVQI